MATSQKEILIKLLADVSDVKKKMPQAEQSMDGFIKSALNIAKVTAGVTAFIKVMGKSIDAAAEHERIVNQLNQSLANQGKYTERASEALQQYAEEIQKTTLFDNTAAVQSMALISAYGYEGSTLMQLTKATTDLAQAKGMDLASASSVVAKSVGTSTNALARYGITVDGTAKSTERAASAIQSIEKLYGGQAAAATSGFGVLKQIGNQMGDVFKNIGMAIEPVVVLIGRDLLNVLSSLNDWFSANMGTIRNFFTIFAENFKVLFTISKAFVKFQTTKMTQGMFAAVRGLGDQFKETKGAIGAIRGSTDEYISGRSGRPVNRAIAGGEGGGGISGSAQTSALMPAAGFSDEGLKQYRDSLQLTADEALVVFLGIGQAFSNDIVGGLVNGTLEMETVWNNFLINMGTAWVNQLLIPLTAGMTELSISMTTIFNQTIGQLLDPIMSFVGSAIGAVGRMFATFILQTLGFQQIFTMVTTGLSMVWNALANNVITQWLLAMAITIASTITAALVAAWAWAAVAATAAAASVAMIPFLGWILSPIVYFATMALMIGGPIAIIAGLAEGSPDIQEDGIAQFSKGEMMIPETFSEGIRSGDLALVGGGQEGASSAQAPVAVSLSGAQFIGNIDDQMAYGIGEKIGLGIKNNLIAPLPT